MEYLHLAMGEAHTIKSAVKSSNAPAHTSPIYAGDLDLNIGRWCGQKVYAVYRMCTARMNANAQQQKRMRVWVCVFVCACDYCMNVRWTLAYEEWGYGTGIGFSFVLTSFHKIDD